MRKVKSVIACAAGILVACAACVGQTTSPSLSHAALKKMISEAHTAEQYKTLATYFSLRGERYEQKADEEKHEWLELSRGNFVPNQKYPRPADSSRNRYEYFTYKAQQMNAQASSYQRLATSARQ
jgi:hypothetical protein